MVMSISKVVANKYAHRIELIVPIARIIETCRSWLPRRACTKATVTHQGSAEIDAISNISIAPLYCAPNKFEIMGTLKKTATKAITNPMKKLINAKLRISLLDVLPSWVFLATLGNIMAPASPTAIGMDFEIVAAAAYNPDS